MPLIEQLPRRIDPVSAMDVFWLVKELTPADAIRVLVDAEATPPPTQEIVQEIEAEWRKTGGPFRVINSLLELSNRSVRFDIEADNVPVDFVGLMGEFVAVSRHVFDADSFVQEHDEGDEETAYHISYEYNGSIHQFTANDYGDYYDASALMDSFNAALEEANRPGRFIALYTGDQFAMLTFAPESEFRQAAKALCLPVTELVNYSWKEGDWVDLRALLEQVDAR